MIKKRRYKSCHQFHFLSIMLIYHPSSSSWTMMIGTKMNECSRKRWPQISITRGTLFLLWDNLFFFAKPRCLLSAFVRPHCVLHVVHDRYQPTSVRKFCHVTWDDLSGGVLCFCTMFTHVYLSTVSRSIPT